MTKRSFLIFSIENGKYQKEKKKIREIDSFHVFFGLNFLNFSGLFNLIFQLSKVTSLDTKSAYESRKNELLYLYWITLLIVSQPSADDESQSSKKYQIKNSTGTRPGRQAYIRQGIIIYWRVFSSIISYNYRVTHMETY